MLTAIVPSDSHGLSNLSHIMSLDPIHMGTIGSYMYSDHLVKKFGILKLTEIILQGFGVRSGRDFIQGGGRRRISPPPFENSPPF